MRKRYGKTGVLGLALAICLCSGGTPQAFAAGGTVNYNTVSAVDFSDNAWSSFSGSGTVTQADGTKVEITKNDGVSMGIKSAADENFVKDVNGAAKYLQYDATTGNGANVLTITPKNALKEDFSFEFKAAGKKVASDDARYLSVVMMPDGAPSTYYGTTVMGWKDKYLYDTGTEGSSSRWPNQRTAMWIPIPGWGEDAKGALTFSENKLVSYKVDVHFNANDVPTFDLWGDTTYGSNGTKLETDSGGRELLLKGVKFPAQTKVNEENVNVDYTGGIGSIIIEMGSTCANEAIAIADMKINKSDDSAEMNLDFEADSYKTAFEQSGYVKSTLNWSNGMSLEMNSKAAVTLTDNGFVKNNKAGNKYMEITATMGGGNDQNSELTLKFPETMKQSFVTEYKFAIDAPYPADGINSYWAQNTNSIIFNAKNASAVGSRLFYVLGNDRYGEPKPFGDVKPSTQWSAGSAVSGISYESGQAFETIRVVTNIKGSGVPTADVYRKADGKDYWQLVKKGISYSGYLWGSQESGGNAIDYTNGIGSISIRTDAGATGGAMNGKTIKYAIDDIRVYPLGENDVYVNAFELNKSGSTYTANVGITNNTSSQAAYELILCAYDKDGKMLDVKTADITAAAGGSGENSTLSAGGSGAAYAKLYMVDSLNGLNIKAQTLTY